MVLTLAACVTDASGGASSDAIEGDSNALTTDFIGYWKFDETSGTSAADANATPHPGTLFNGGSGGQGPTWTSSGRIGAAVTLDGVDDNIRIPDLNFGPSATIALWFKVNDNSHDHGTLYSHGTPYATNSVTILIAGSNDGSIWTYVCDQADTNCDVGIGVDNPPGTSWADGSWHHYALVLSSTQNAGKIYVDGQFKKNVARGGSTINPSGLIHIGRSADGQYPLNGAIDDLRLYNRALSAQEIVELYRYPVPFDHIGYWRMDEAAGTTTADDFTATPHPGTLYNGSTANTQGPAWVTGKIGSGLGFDGVDDSLRIRDFGYGPGFSLALWFKIANNTGGHQTLFSHGTNFTRNSLMVRMAGNGDGSIWTYLCDSAARPARRPARACRVTRRRSRGTDTPAPTPWTKWRRSTSAISITAGTKV